jgi:hypothetical protein
MFERASRNPVLLRGARLLALLNVRARREAA